MGQVPIRHGPRRIALVVVTAMAMLAIPAGVSAGAAAFTFDLQLGSGCVDGTGPPSASILLRLYDPDGNLVDSETVESDAGGDWSSQECFWYRINGGDRLRATSASLDRTFTIPNITAKIDRVSDVVSGKAPSTGTFQIFTQDCDLDECLNGPSPIVPVASNGTYARDFTSLVNLAGFDLVLPSWTSGGDRVFGRTARVPYMQVVINEPQVFGQGNPQTEVTVQLRTSGGTLIASGRDFARRRAPSFNMDLETSAGRLAYPKPGQKVKASFASNATMTIPVISLSSAATSVSGTCFPNAHVYVYLDHYAPSYDWTEGFATSGSGGAFTLAIADSSNPAYDHGSGDRWDVQCLSAKGDTAERYGRLP